MRGYEPLGGEGELMNLAEIKRDGKLFLSKVQAARAGATSEVHVNSGVKTPEDVAAILNNTVTEPVDWRQAYHYAAEFD